MLARLRRLHAHAHAQSADMHQLACACANIAAQGSLERHAHTCGRGDVAVSAAARRALPPMQQCATLRRRPAGGDDGLQPLLQQVLVAARVDEVA